MGSCSKSAFRGGVDCFCPLESQGLSLRKETAFCSRSVVRKPKARPVRSLYQSEAVRNPKQHATERQSGGDASTSGRRVPTPPPKWVRRQSGEPLMRKAGLPPEVLETVRLLAGEEDPQMIKALLIRLEAVSRGLVVTTFDEFERRGNARCCVRVLLFMLDQGNYQREEKYVNKAFNLLIRQNSWKALESLYEEVKRERVELDIVVYNTILKGYAMTGNVEGAATLLETMREAGLQPDGRSYTHLMTTYAKSGDIQGAARLLDDIKAAGLLMNKFHFGVLINAYAKQDNVDEAMSVLQRMADEGVELDQVLYQLVVNLLCKNGLPSRALEYLREMKSKGLQPTITSYRKVMDGFASLGEAAEAYKLLKEMISDGVSPTAGPYTSVIAALTRDGDLATAKQVFQEATSSGVQFEEDQLSFGALRYLLRELVERKEIAEAEDLLQQIRSVYSPKEEFAIVGLQRLIDDSKDLASSF